MDNARIEARIEVKKVDRGWYTYLVEGNGIAKVGHGRRRFVYDRVAAALEEINSRC